MSHAQSEGRRPTHDNIGGSPSSIHPGVLLTTETRFIPDAGLSESATGHDETATRAARPPASSAATQTVRSPLDPDDPHDAAQVSPHKFAQNHRQWGDEQTKSDKLLCGRPVKRTADLPIVVYHEAFRNFSCMVHSKEDLPLDECGRNAMLAAVRLRDEMGNEFASEQQRSEAFNVCVSPLFPSKSWTMQFRVHGRRVTGIADAAFVVNFGGTRKRPVVLREDKAEPGSNGDPQMQVARVYQLFVEALQESSEDEAAKGLLAEGAPTFLLCVSGTILMAFGAYYCGVQNVVQPLGHNLQMLKERMYDPQQDELARTLYELFRGIEGLTRIHTSAPSQLDVPRIYTSSNSIAFPQLSFRLVLNSRLGGRNTVFLGVLDWGRFQSDVAVKLVARHYGTQVHRFLAAGGFAPLLHAIADYEGAPRAYIMEQLTPGDWSTLEDLVKYAHDKFVLARPAIRKTLKKIIGLLRKRRYVHGDLRPGNIMVKTDQMGKPLVDEGGYTKLKLVGFEWAGSLGVMYITNSSSF